MSVPRSAAAWLAALLAALSAGCAARKPQTYRLVSQDRARILVPPGVAGAEAGSGTVSVGAAAWRPECAPTGNAITVQPRKGTLRMVVSRDELLRQAAGWLREWVVLLEKRGCIAAGRGMELATRIVESLPLDPAAAHRLLHAGTIQKGFVDILPDYRLQVVTPIMKDGATTVSPD
jgi:hypothetical protein